MKENVKLFAIAFFASLVAIAINDLVVKQVVQAQLDKQKTTPVGSLLTSLFGSSGS